MARSSDDNEICYVVPVLWVRSRFHTTGHKLAGQPAVPCSANQPSKSVGWLVGV